MKLTVQVGTKFTVINNPKLGVLTVTKIGYLVDEFGDKTSRQAAKYTNASGQPVGCTPLDLMTSEWFELCAEQ